MIDIMDAHEDPMPAVVLLGGIGPAATAHMHQLLIREAQQQYGATQDRDFPPIIVMNAPPPGTSPHGWSNDTLDEIAHALIRSLRIANTLEKQVGVVLPACNTLDLLRPQLQHEACKAPVLSLPLLSAACAARRGDYRVGVLESRTARSQRLFARCLAAFGLQALEVSESDQHQLDDLICQVMAGQHDAVARDQMNQIACGLLKRGADVVLVGCTELSVLAPAGEEIPLIDSAAEGITRALAIVYRKGNQHASV